MFEKIYNHSILTEIITICCSENNIEVCVDSKLNIDSDDRLLILKPDGYYSSQRMHNPPPSIDCIILVKCKESSQYSINLIELRDITSKKGFDKNNIKDKFENVINDFLNHTFKDIFLNEEYCDFKCFFVTNPYNLNNITQEEYEKIIHTKGLKLDYFNSLKPFKFKNKISIINSVLPNPIIKDC